MARIHLKTKKSLIPKEIFRAYDIRGIYPNQINEALAYTVAHALGNYFRIKVRGRKPTVVMAHDARIGSPELYRAVIQGTEDAGKINITKVGLSTTPMFYFLVNNLRADYGIMVTASHNPKEYNGLKVVGKSAQMISGKEVLKIVNKELRIMDPVT